MRFSDRIIVGLSSNRLSIGGSNSESFQCNLELKDFVAGAVFGATQSFLQDLKQSYQFKNKAPTLLEDHWGISNLSLVALFLVWQPCFQSAQNSLLTQFFGCQLVFLSSTFFEENTSSSPKFCLLKWSARHVKMVC